MRKVRRKHVLAFPLFGKGTTVVGDLKIKLSILEKKKNHQNLKNITYPQRSIVAS